MSVKSVVMPALGVAMSEGVLLQWLRSPGETVAAGDFEQAVRTLMARGES
jgi:pyruvate/2-oxoglutarate dehydrogenase complex dihydrolipoamide acyltransferase (E2) component